VTAPFLFFACVADFLSASPQIKKIGQKRCNLSSDRATFPHQRGLLKPAANAGSLPLEVGTIPRTALTTARRDARR
jgi:hypothetical protein